MWAVSCSMRMGRLISWQVFLLQKELMERYGYEEEEKARILRAIENHRNRAIREEKSLTGIIYRADKMSRSCFGCKAEKECDWSPEKKNLRIEY